MSGPVRRFTPLPVTVPMSTVPLMPGVLEGSAVGVADGESLGVGVGSFFAAVNLT